MKNNFFSCLLRCIMFLCSSKIAYFRILMALFLPESYLATLAISWGGNFNFIDLNRVSNFSQRCLLSYKILLVVQIENWESLNYVSYNGFPCGIIVFFSKGNNSKIVGIVGKTLFYNDDTQLRPFSPKDTLFIESLWTNFLHYRFSGHKKVDI